MRPEVDASADAVRAAADVVDDVIVVLPDERHLGRRCRRRSTEERHVVAVQRDLRLRLLQDVRLGEVVAGEALVRDLSDGPALQVFRMSASSLTASDLGFVDPLRKPLEVAIAEQRVAVDLDGVELRKVGEGILLDGGDDVVGEVKLLQQ